MAIKSVSKLLQPRVCVDSRDGFSLIELLVVSILGSVVTIAAAQVLINHVRSSVSTEALLRAQDTWSRLQFLLDQEIQEAESISVSGSTLTLTMPRVNNVTDTIAYTLSGSDLIRTGPNINTGTGALIPGTSIQATLLDNVIQFTPVLSGGNNRTVTYTLNTKDPSGFQFREAKITSAQTRTRIL